MSEFERIFQTDPSRELQFEIESPSIELSDQEHLERIRPRVNKNMQEEGFVYRELPREESMSPALKDKFEKARKISKDTKAIDLKYNEPPLIPMNLKMPELEKSIREGKKHAKNKSKAIEGKPKKVSTRPNSSAMESLQEKL